MPLTFPRCLTRFARDDEGAVTVEAVLWIPFFFFLLMLITDASLAFFAKAQAFRAIEDGNRAFSVGVLANESATKAYIEDRFDPLSSRAVATTTYNSSSRIIRTVLEFPARDVVAFNTLGVMSGWSITVGAEQYREWVR